MAVTKAATAGNILFMAGSLVWGQSPATPAAFEVASVKPSTPGSPAMAINRAPGRLSTSRTPLKFLITWAYSIEEDRLIGAPKGSDAIEYDIVAKISNEKLAPGELQRMMQSLLVERFKLVVHRETRDLPLYTLVTEKDGPKVHFVDLGDGIGQNPFHMTDRGRLVGTKVTAEMLAKVLSGLVGRPVQDSTGIGGVFDFTLEWTPDTDLDYPNRPSIFTAIKEQLGFGLNSRKSEVEVLVIDRVENRPTGN